jgi:hypothetical protein
MRWYNAAMTVLFDITMTVSIGLLMVSMYFWTRMVVYLVIVALMHHPRFPRHPYLEAQRRAFIHSAARAVQSGLFGGVVFSALGIAVAGVAGRMIGR